MPDVSFARVCRVQLQSDGRERVKEALVAVLTAALRPPHNQAQDSSQPPAVSEATQGVSVVTAGWLNPGEEQVTVDEGAEMLREAIAVYHCQNEGALPGSDIIGAGRESGHDIRTFAQIVNALGTGGALEAAADAILGIGPTQQTLAAVAQLPESELSPTSPEVLCASNQHATATSATIIGQQKILGNGGSTEHRNWLIRALRCSQQQDAGVLCVEHLGTIQFSGLIFDVFPLAVSHASWDRW